MKPELDETLNQDQKIENGLFLILGALCAVAVGMMLFGANSFMPDRSPASEPKPPLHDPDSVPFDPRAYYLSKNC